VARARSFEDLRSVTGAVTGHGSGRGQGAHVVGQRRTTARASRLRLPERPLDGGEAGTVARSKASRAVGIIGAVGSTYMSKKIWRRVSKLRWA
jgi:hypothetical protein